MNDKLFITMLKRYEADIEDALYKIECINEHGLIIPEHTGITDEVDKLLLKVSETEGKLAALRQHYGKREAKTVL
jgi:hypothetical protein